MDTECDICLIKLSVPRECDLQVSPANKQLMVYDNTKNNVVVTSAGLPIDKVVETVELWLLEDSAQQTIRFIDRTDFYRMWKRHF